MPSFKVGLLDQSEAEFYSLLRDVGPDFFGGPIRAEYLAKNIIPFKSVLINYKELRKYVQIRYNIESINNYITSEYITEFRPCTRKDFNDNNLKNVFDVKLRFCPPHELVKD